MKLDVFLICESDLNITDLIKKYIDMRNHLINGVERVKKYGFENQTKQSLKKHINQNTHEIKALQIAIEEIKAKLNYQKITEHFKTLSDNPERINLQQMWKLMKKLWPKVETKLPSAKKNHKGQVISEPNSLKLLLAKEYKERLRQRPVRSDFDDLEKRKNEIFKFEQKQAMDNAKFI